MRHSIFTRLFWGLMGLYLLNISVDAVDPYPDYIPEDLSVNDQESIVEIVVEEILGYEDAIDEFDEHDNEDHSKRIKTKIEIVPHFRIDPAICFRLTSRKKNINHIDIVLTSGFKQEYTPPPEV